MITQIKNLITQISISRNNLRNLFKNLCNHFMNCEVLT